jgi:hypothetical protein
MKMLINTIGFGIAVDCLDNEFYSLSMPGVGKSRGPAQLDSLQFQSIFRRNGICFA